MGKVAGDLYEPVAKSESQAIEVRGQNDGFNCSSAEVPRSLHGLGKDLATVTVSAMLGQHADDDRDVSCVTGRSYGCPPDQVATGVGDRQAIAAGPLSYLGPRKRGRVDDDVVNVPPVLDSHLRHRHNPER